MNTKSNIYIRGHEVYFTHEHATRENTAFGIYSVKENSILHWKNQVSLSTARNDLSLFVFILAGSLVTHTYTSVLL